MTKSELFMHFAERFGMAGRGGWHRKTTAHGLTTLHLKSRETRADSFPVRKRR